MTSRNPTPHSHSDTLLLIGRLLRLRQEWRLDPADFQTLFGMSATSLVHLARKLGPPLVGRIHARVRALDELASIARGYLAGDDPAAWLRAPCDRLCRQAPLQVLSEKRDGIGIVGRHLRETCEAGRP